MINVLENLFSHKASLDGRCLSSHNFTWYFFSMYTSPLSLWMPTLSILTKHKYCWIGNSLLVLFSLDPPFRLLYPNIVTFSSIQILAVKFKNMKFWFTYISVCVCVCLGLSFSFCLCAWAWTQGTEHTKHMLCHEYHGTCYQSKNNALKTKFLHIV